MKEFTFELAETVRYRATVIELNETKARALIEERLEGGEIEACRDVYLSEVDNSGMEIVESEEPRAWNPASHWDNHDTYFVKDWQYEVANTDTRQSYVDWVNAQIALHGEDS